MDIKEKIVSWIIMLDCDDFKGTDAGLVREEMLDLIEIPRKSEKTLYEVTHKSKD